MHQNQRGPLGGMRSPRERGLERTSETERKSLTSRRFTEREGVPNWLNSLKEAAMSGGGIIKSRGKKNETNPLNKKEVGFKGEIVRIEDSDSRLRGITSGEKGRDAEGEREKRLIASW